MDQGFRIGERTPIFVKISGTEYSVRTGLSLGKRMNERIFTQIEYEYDESSARNSRFDTRNSAVSARIDYLLTESVQVVDRLCLGQRQVCDIYPRQPCPPHCSGRRHRGYLSGADALAFQLPATAQVFSLGASIALARHWSADISADFADIYGKGDTILIQSIGRASSIPTDSCRVARGENDFITASSNVFCQRSWQSARCYSPAAPSR